jgi:hypothetical protein
MLVHQPASGDSITEARLLTARWGLQEEIVALLDSNSSKAEDGALLQNKKASYNQVMDSLQDIQQSLTSRMDPMDKLPNELWNIILMGYIEYMYSFPRRRSDRLFSLMTVSQRWRHYMLSAPDLWTHIYLNAKGRNLVSSLTRVLDLSRDLPLTLTCEVLSTQWTELLPLLLPHRSRITHLTISSRYPYEFLQGIETMQKILGDLTPLPNLRHLSDVWGYESLAAEDDFVCKLFDQSPLLERLEDIVFSSKPLLEAKDKLTLREVSIYANSIRDSSVLEGFPSLRQVQLFALSGEEPLTHFSPQQTHQLYWTHLGSTLRLHSSILHRLPLLTCLSLEISRLEDLEQTIMVFHRLPCLEKFIGHVYFVESSHSFELASPVIPNHRIRSIVLDTFDSPNEPASGNSNRISEAFAQVAPSVQYLKLGAKLEVVKLWNWDRYENLKRVSIQTVNGEMDTAFPRSVERFSIFSVHDLSSLKAQPSVKILDIEVDILSCNVNMVVSEKDALIDLTEWPALETANVQSIYARFLGASVSSLRRISISSLYAGWTNDLHITRFINEMARNPRDLPCLEEIKLNDFPEWDILIIMLERRNLLSGPDITPIKRLSLPFTSPPHISRLLPGLLAGKWVQRPSNLALSVVATIKDILDHRK